MDGTAISGIMKIAFLFSLFGLNFFTPGNIAAAIAIAVPNAVVIAGIPGEGYAGELFIISVYGFPLEAFPLIVMIGTIIDAQQLWLTLQEISPLQCLLLGYYTVGIGGDIVTKQV